MINDLKYAVTFPTNGVSLKGDISFQPGSTAITGDNGAGKSFVAEMIRYGLFGKKALRGPASDYKTLDMELSFLGHRVVRGKKEFLYDNDNEQLAVGADAVNKKIVELLGFELEVFDVVCAANQKESERLTRLTPARRKELIDDVVGLTRQEDVEKACKEEAKTARTEAETLTRMLVLPVEPVKPEGYRPSQTLKAEFDETVSILAKRVKLQRIIDAVPAEPVKPSELCPDVKALEAHEKSRIENEARRVALRGQLASIATTTLTLKDIEQAEALAEYHAELKRRGPRPTYSMDELREWESILEQKALLKEPGATCPKCSHEFLLDCPDVDIEEIQNLGSPPLSLKEIDQQLYRHRLWPDDVEAPSGQSLTAQEIRDARVALQQADTREQIRKELALPELDNKSTELAAARRLEREWDFYSRQLDHYAACAAEAANAQYELDRLPTPKSAPEDLNHAYTEARVYEEQRTNYAIAKDHFDELTAEIGAKQQRAEAFTAGAKGLVEARRTLKAFLAPSLSRVASQTIQLMTENSLRPIDTIIVDEDMNITADGQDVSTFNGAHATMINLALRLALGQVLVARVFPVFIGDEIDSDATPANAQAIADGLMACKDQLKQIVLISHKELQGTDHAITL